MTRAFLAAHEGGKRVLCNKPHLWRYWEDLLRVAPPSCRKRVTPEKPVVRTSEIRAVDILDALLSEQFIHTAYLLQSLGKSIVCISVQRPFALLTELLNTAFRRLPCL